MQKHNSSMTLKKLLVLSAVLAFVFFNPFQKTFAATCGGDTFGTCTGSSACVWLTPSTSNGMVGRYECSGSTACSACTEDQLCKIWYAPGTTNIVSRECINLTCASSCSGANTECVCVEFVGCSCEDTGSVPEENPADPIIPGAELGSGFDLGNFIRLLYNILFPLAIVIGLFLIAGGGYAFMTSQGDPQKVMGAKENLTSAIIGLVFVLLSVGILRIIMRILFSSLLSGGDVGF